MIYKEDFSNPKSFIEFIKVWGIIHNTYENQFVSIIGLLFKYGVYKQSGLNINDFHVIISMYQTVKHIQKFHGNNSKLYEHNFKHVLYEKLLEIRKENMMKRKKVKSEKEHAKISGKEELMDMLLRDLWRVDLWK